jgi:hypothetical protein
VARLATLMAKSDSFFIRAKISGLTAGAFGQISIDLGAYVDALGMSVLRIHRLSTQYVFGNFLAPTVTIANGEASANWQLTTQSQAALVDATDKSVISTGNLQSVNATAVANHYSFSTQDVDINPEDWTNGYLIGVEQIYLGGEATNFEHECDIIVVLECTVEKLSSSAAMALALSQQ